MVDNGLNHNILRMNQDMTKKLNFYFQSPLGKNMKNLSLHLASSWSKRQLRE